MSFAAKRCSFQEVRTILTMFASASSVVASAVPSPIAIAGARRIARSCCASVSASTHLSKTLTRKQCHIRAIHLTRHTLRLTSPITLLEKRLGSVTSISSSNNNFQQQHIERSRFWSLSFVRHMSGSNVHEGNRSSLPPGSFATGGVWDSVPKTTTTTTTTTTPTMTHNTQELHDNRNNSPKTSTVAWDSLKDQISSTLEPETQSNIEWNKNKLEAISKVIGRKQTYSPYLLISQLPHTVMPDDIKRMAVTEDSIADIIYHRTPFMEFQGKVTVIFRSATDAVEFITQRYGKFLSGHRLSMNMLDPYDPRDKKLVPPFLLSQPLSGQLVLVSGLPAASRPDHLRTEFRRFHLVDTTEAAIIAVPSHVKATTCQYLVRLASRSEAFRFVRTYHNTFFQQKEFRKRCPIRATIIY